METISCLICRSEKASPFIQAQDFENPTDTFYSLEQCAQCGLVYQNPRPTLEELPNYYSNEKYYSYKELENKLSQKKGFFERVRQFLFEKTIFFYYGGKRSPIDWIFAWIGKGRFGSAPLQLKPGRICDIGCGDGVFLDLVKQCGWEPYGVEINSDAAKRANQAGLNVHAGDLLTAPFEEEFFDVVRMWSVLEHVPQPKAVLERIKKILKPGGVLILQVPNVRSFAFSLFGPFWTGLDLPRHLTHFSPKTIKESLQTLGFKVEQIQCASVGTGWASFKYRQRMKRNGNKGLADSFFDPIMRIGNILFDRFCDLVGKGDCLFVWARK